MEILLKTLFILSQLLFLQIVDSIAGNMSQSNLSNSQSKTSSEMYSIKDSSTGINACIRVTMSSYNSFLRLSLDDKRTNEFGIMLLNVEDNIVRMKITGTDEQVTAKINDNIFTNIYNDRLTIVWMSKKTGEVVLRISG